VSAPESARRAELAANLTTVRGSIEAACAAAGRDAAEVTLVAVTKTYPASDVLHLAALGVADIGENRDQEAAPKAAEVAAAVAVADADVRWHFVGQLQRNKCRSVVGYAELVHSVDSVTLARTLDGAVERHRGRPLDVLVQVSIDGDPSRGGALVPAPQSLGERDFDRVAEAVAESRWLTLRGVMAVAPVSWHPERAFAELARTAEHLRVGYPTATTISAGMSADLREAIAHGATLVRVGSGLLGNRAALR
jgi:pyridoxal phosphate enzyme (YggS family)